MVERIRVWPKNEAIAKAIKHPSGATLKDKAGDLWPADQFTYRRLRDGDITEKEPVVESQKPPPPRPAPG